MALANEYEKLLRYLESQNTISAIPAPKTKKAEPTKKELASENTKKLLEEATIDDFTDLPHIHVRRTHQSKN